MWGLQRMTDTSAARSQVEKFMRLVDSGQFDEAMSFMADDIRFTFGNQEPITGRDTAAAALGSVLAQCEKIEHSVVTWFESAKDDGGTDTLAEVRVTYHLKGGRVVSIPACLFTSVTSDGRFTEQRLYADMAPVLAGGE
jgi:hypothetical protein